MQMRYLPHQMSSRFFDGMRARGVVSERLFTVARNLPPVSMYGLRSVLAPVSPMPGTLSAPKSPISRLQGHQESHHQHRGRHTPGDRPDVDATGGHQTQTAEQDHRRHPQRHALMLDS